VPSVSTINVPVAKNGRRWFDLPVLELKSGLGFEFDLVDQETR
jgi:hypothetical protein